MKNTMIYIAALIFASCGTEDPGIAPISRTSPDITRTSPEVCDNERPNQNFDPVNSPPSTNGGCDSDAKCTEGLNGRCLLDSNFGRECTYDGCFNDDDCGTDTVCSCGQDRHSDSKFGRADENVCVSAACRTNEDCGDEFCKPNSGQCHEGRGRVSQYFCTTENDECRNDSDCSDDLICSFSPDLKHWRCVSECQ